MAEDMCQANAGGRREVERGKVLSRSEPVIPTHQRKQAAQIKVVPVSLFETWHVLSRSCSIAAAFFKVVSASERGSWGEYLIQEREEAWEAGTPSGKQLAWWIAAERGHETGRNKLALINKSS